MRSWDTHTHTHTFMGMQSVSLLCCDFWLKPYLGVLSRRLHAGGCVVAFSVLWCYANSEPEGNPVPVSTSSLSAVF